MVTLVTAPLNPVNPPRTFAEKDETLFTTEAAKEEPGIFGIEIVGGGPPTVEAVGIAVGLIVDVVGLGIAGS